MFFHITSFTLDRYCPHYRLADRNFSKPGFVQYMTQALRNRREDISHIACPTAIHL